MAKQIFDFVSASAEFHTDFKYQVDSNFYLRAPSSPIIVEITAENCQPMANLKTGVSRKQSMSNFLKNEHFLLPDMHTYVFQKIWRALFSSNTCSEIRSFALLPTKLVKHFVKDFLRKHYTFSFGPAPLEFTFFFQISETNLVIWIDI